MKIVLSILPIIASVLFTSCSEHNAFKPFEYTHQKSLNEDTILTLKIKKGERVDGIVSVVYLNKVFPKEYKTKEYFYVYYYLKDTNETLSFSLNGKEPLFVEDLQAETKFSTLSAFDAPWSKYKLVTFQKEGNILNFKITTNKAANATLHFIKDK